MEIYVQCTQMSCNDGLDKLYVGELEGYESLCGHKLTLKGTDTDLDRYNVIDLENVQEWADWLEQLEDSHLTVDIIDTYMEVQGELFTPNELNIMETEEAFVGEYASLGDFVYEFLDEMYDLPEEIMRYINLDDFWEGELRHDYVYENTYVFRVV